MKRYLGLVVALGALAPATAQAATFTVTNTNDTGAGSLRSALGAAESASGADVIQIDASGIITLNSELPEIDHSVTIKGGGPGVLAIRRALAAPQFRILTISSSTTTAVIEGLEVAQGAPPASGGVAQGGGVLVNGGSVTLRNVEVTDNSALGTTPAPAVCVTPGAGGGGAGQGGGIYVSSGSLTLDQSSVSDNTATGGVGCDGAPGCVPFPGSGGNAKGGGIYLAAGNLTLRGTTVHGNTATAGAGGLGNGCPIDGIAGSATGGGIAAPRGDLDIGASTVSLNVAAGAPAGIAPGSAPGTGTGGGIYSGAQDAEIVNSTISGNGASAGSGGFATNGGQGGGVALSDDAAITASTINLNSVGPPATGSSVGPSILLSGETIVSIRNTIIAGGSGAITPSNCSSTFGTGTFVSDGFNLESLAAGTPSCGFSQPTDQFVSDAGLELLANNGGPTRTHALELTSPSIDQGDAGSLVNDQRGLPRSFNVPSVVNEPTGDGTDVGAFELTDTDGDGTENGADPDDDGDGVLDSADGCPLVGSDSIDTDGDGTCNSTDSDDDGDGTPDTTDEFPLDPTRDGSENNDVTPPDAVAGGAKTQRLGKTVKVKVTSDEASQANASGKLILTPASEPAAKRKRKRFKLGSATASVLAGGTSTMRLKVGKKARRVAARILKTGGAAKAKVTVVVTDAAGNPATVTRAIKIKPAKRKRG